MKSENERLFNNLDDKISELDLIKKELESIKIKYNQVRLDHTDLKETHQTLLETNLKTASSLETAITKFNQLKHHAEKKLEQANIEIARVRINNEQELAGIRAKSLRAEMRIGTLERGIDDKIKENKELTRICDELVTQMEICANK
jgi:transforming acidic coiled-coil-containing protein 3